MNVVDKDAPRLVYATAANRAEAITIARAVVKERLAACANVLGGARSIYWWEGNLEEADEVAVVMKTRAGLVERLIARVKAMHSYTVPAIVALPILAGNPDYLQWIGDETTEVEETPQKDML